MLQVAVLCALGVRIRDFMAEHDRKWARHKVNNNEKFRSFKSKKTFIRKMLGHTAVSAIKASSVTL